MQNFIEINGRKYPILEYKWKNEKTQPCVYCEKRHKHGKKDGHRLSHCTKYSRYGNQIATHEYTCTLSDGTIVDYRFGYYIKMI